MAPINRRQLETEQDDSPTSREVFRNAPLQLGAADLEDHGYVEVETLMLTPFATGAQRDHSRLTTTRSVSTYTRIAPELHLKRLLVGGFERSIELNFAMRVSQLVNPEFTMLEFTGPRRREPDDGLL